jgi:hypothetical protein
LTESNKEQNVYFKVGDWVELLNDSYNHGFLDILRTGHILPVVDSLPREDDGYWISRNGAKVSSINLSCYKRDFKLVQSPLKEDSKEVILPCTRNPETGNLTFGDLYKDTITPQEVDGIIARPILSERKVGKVPVHMVIDGFPRALREVGKVLGWAADAKQYKLHDWKNLPDADIEFPSAGYRHMLDNSEMKSEGIAAIDRVDHESHKLHLAHEIFNKLAELELVLTGVIK